MMHLLVFLLCLAVTNASPVRICVQEQLAEFCSQMSQDLPESFSCVLAPDTFGCLEKVKNFEADLTAVDANGLFLAGKYFNLEPVITELVDGEPYRYQGIALVSKNNDSIQSAADLRGKRSCHTGFWRTVGWQIPISRLLREIMEPSCEEGELAAANNFFGGSCLAGNWSKDPAVDRELKKKYPKLCSQCKDPEACSQDDPHYGYEGVIKCLTDGYGDVAFTKIPVLRDYLTKDPSLAEKAELLCFDGGRKSVEDPEPCIWGVRPTNAYVARAESEEEIERMVEIMLQTQIRYSNPKVRTPTWYHKTFLTHEKVSGIKKTEFARRTFLDYLGDFLLTIRKPRDRCGPLQDRDQVKFCVTSTEEESKCEAFSKAADARGIWPHVLCVRGASKAACMEILKEGHAQLLTLDGGDMYKAGRYYNLDPLAGELYGDLDATYYSIAVQRSESDVSRLADLKGGRSCHTGIGRTAGWVMPIGALLTEGLLEADDGTCNHAKSLADFFSAGSCVPGANDTKYNPARIRSEDLCRHCVGNEEGLHRCARDSSERYSGYSGAFRCLAEGNGDVAFVRHSTPQEHTDGHSELPWAKDLVSSDFKLLCADNGTAPISEYLTCNLGKVPSHHVVTKRDVPAARRLLLASLLADSSRYFDDSSPLFKLFFKRHGSDLLFKDSTTGLKIIPSGETYEQVLGQRFLDASRASDPKNCEINDMIF